MVPMRIVFITLQYYPFTLPYEYFKNPTSNPLVIYIWMYDVYYLSIIRGHDRKTTFYNGSLH